MTRVADDPRAAELGERVFFDTRLSGGGRVSCGTCHDPTRELQDGIPLGKGVGETSRRTMPVAATAHSPLLFWDGRKDSQWAQALGPPERPVEHGGTRDQYWRVIAEHYRADYERIFGTLPALEGIPSVAGPVDDPAARAAGAGMSTPDRLARWQRSSTITTVRRKPHLATANSSRCASAHGSNDRSKPSFAR